MGNQNSGRRPQPTTLTVLRGNPSRKKLNEHEPVPPPGEVSKPIGLSAGANVVWDELAPICLAMGTLSVADVRVFATLCELQAVFQAASADKDLAEPTHLDGVLKRQRETANVLRPYYALFGLEPVSRARISVPKKDAPVSKWAGALK